MRLRFRAVLSVVALVLMTGCAHTVVLHNADAPATDCTSLAPMCFPAGQAGVYDGARDWIYLTAAGPSTVTLFVRIQGAEVDWSVDVGNNEVARIQGSAMGRIVTLDNIALTAGQRLTLNLETANSDARLAFGYVVHR